MKVDIDKIIADRNNSKTGKHITPQLRVLIEAERVKRNALCDNWVVDFTAPRSVLQEQIKERIWLFNRFNEAARALDNF